MSKSIDNEKEYQRRAELREKHQEEQSKSLRSFMIGRIIPDPVVPIIDIITDAKKD